MTDQELIQALIDYTKQDDWPIVDSDVIQLAIDRLSALQSENADLRIGFSRAVAEWNAAMEYVPHACSTCKHKGNGVCGMGCEFTSLTINYAERCNWEWRGAQGEG